MPLDNPIDAYLRAAQSQNQNRQQMNQDLSGLGQAIGGGLGNIGQLIQQKKKKEQWAKTINNLMQDPNTSPQMKQMLPLIAQRPELMSQLGPSMVKAQTQRIGGAGKRVVYQNPDGSVSLSPVEGATPLEVSDAQAMQYTAVPKSAKEKNVAMGSRAEAIQRGIDVRQIDQLAKQTGITPGQRNLLQQNNMRASRAVELASQPMTWQEFNNVLTDAAAIMQGGVPHIDQIHNMTYPTWQEDFAKWRTLATSQPTMNVPAEIRNRVISMVRGIQKVDNRYLAKNAEFQQKMLGPTVRGGIEQFKAPIQEMTSTITGIEPTSSPQNDPLGILGQ